MTKQALEVVEFTLNDGIEEKAFLTAIEATRSFVSSLDGFIERSTAQKDNGLWIDVVKWRDMQAAQEAAKQFESAEAVREFVMMIDHGSMKMQHFEAETTM